MSFEDCVVTTSLVPSSEFLDSLLTLVTKIGNLCYLGFYVPLDVSILISIQKAIPTIFLLNSDPVVHSIFNCDFDPTDVKSLND